MTGLTPLEFPYTGPYSVAGDGHHEGPTAVALKRALSRMGYLPWTKFDDKFNLRLEKALDAWDPTGSNGYGSGRWTKIRRARVPMSLPHGGELALDPIAVALVQDEADPVIVIPFVYPHPLGAASHSAGIIHPTRGLEGNIALDFMAPGGTLLLAMFNGKITKLSGHPPSTGVHGEDIFGWSIYLERDDGTWAYTTHEGEQNVHVGQSVVEGQRIGVVGHWPHDEGRSHTHVGITSPAGRQQATRDILAIAAAPRVAPR